MPTKPTVTVAARMVVTLALTLGAACAGAGDSDPGGSDASTLSCSFSTVTYANFGAAFLGKYCNSCHGFTQADVQLDPADPDRRRGDQHLYAPRLARTDHRGANEARHLARLRRPLICSRRGSGRTDGTPSSA
jgi:hypothetical protein